jgi:TPR repeat protein
VIRNALLAVALFVARPVPAASPSLSEADAAYAAGHFEDAHRLWQSRADAGDPRAAFNIGLLYDLGQGVPRDPVTAYRWYRQAADADDPAAEFNVGVMNDSGTGVAHDAAAAARWYARSAAHGNMRAAYNLGQLYAAGDGVPRNPIAATSWFEAAVQGGIQAAAQQLAELTRAVARRHPDADAPFSAPLPVVPQDDATVDGGKHQTLALAWSAPSEPMPVRYFVQVLDLDDGSPPTMVGLYVDQTATSIILPGAAGHFAWRVYAVSRAGGDYAASVWSHFTLQ